MATVERVTPTKAEDEGKKARRWFFGDDALEKAEAGKEPGESVFPVTIEFADGSYTTGYAAGK